MNCVTVNCPSCTCPYPHDLAGDVINIHPAPPDEHPDCSQFLFTANWELTDDALILSDVLLNGQPTPVVDIWLGTTPLTRVG